jgi:hypothetical protein
MSFKCEICKREINDIPIKVWSLIPNSRWTTMDLECVLSWLCQSFDYSLSEIQDYIKTQSEKSVMSEKCPNSLDFLNLYFVLQHGGVLYNNNIRLYNKTKGLFQKIKRFIRLLFLVKFMMPDSEIQSKLSEAYLEAICCTSGNNLYRPVYDCGIDWQIKPLKLLNGKPREIGIGLDLQLKATFDFKIEEYMIKYQLENKNYNQLIEKNVGIKRILVLFLMPKKRDEWINQTPESLILRKCAYWCSLEGMKIAENEKSKTTIEIPIKNIFCKNALKEIFDKINNGENLNGI